DIEKDEVMVVRTGGDEVAVVLPPRVSEERADVIRQETQNVVADMMNDKFAFAKVNIETKDPVKYQATKAWLKEFSVNRGETVFEDLYEEKSGLFMLYDYDRAGETFENSATLINAELAKAGIMNVTVKDAIKIYSPRIGLGGDRVLPLSATPKDAVRTAANPYGDAISRGEVILNVSKEAGGNGAIGKDVRSGEFGTAARNDLIKFETRGHDADLSQKAVTDDVKKQYVQATGESGIKMYPDQVEPYNLAYKREVLGKSGGILSQLEQNDTRHVVIKMAHHYGVGPGANRKLENHMRNNDLDPEGLKDSFRWDDNQDAYGAKMPDELYGHTKFDQAIATQADTYNSVLKEMNIRGAFVVRGPPDNFYIVIPLEGADFVRRDLTVPDYKRFVDFAETKINASMKDMGFDTPVKLTANVVVSDDIDKTLPVPERVNVLISRVDDLASIPGAKTQTASSPVNISRRGFIKKTAKIAGVVAVDPFAAVKAMFHETKQTGITLPEIR
ncbi:MAG: hypothetical protein KAR32_07540, partial [Candidatus Omnitrophica bacterium]|nr:hypothetical protein [Candidatus Omnitrophota bacterium]